MQKSFAKVFDAPTSVWETFASLCELVTFKKNEIIKEAGKVENNGYFILKGSGGVFVWKDNNYVCLDFMLEEEFFGDTMSLYTGEPSPVETLALEDSEMVRISKESIEKLKATPWGQILFLQAAEDDYVNKQKQQIDLLLKTAEERYQELVIQHPQAMLRLPQKYIASYLGITPQSFSRLRKKFMVQ